MQFELYKSKCYNIIELTLLHRFHIKRILQSIHVNYTCPYMLQYEIFTLLHTIIIKKRIYRSIEYH